MEKKEGSGRFLTLLQLPERKLDTCGLVSSPKKQEMRQVEMTSGFSRGGLGWELGKISSPKEL